MVNFRTPDLVIVGAHSLLTDGADDVVIVDNASGDDSLERLGALQDERLQVLQSPTNAGFGTGANAGARHARGDLLFFLNSDAAVRPGCIARLASDFLDPRVGIAAPLVLTPSDVEQPDAYGTFPTVLNTLTRRNRHPSPTLEPDWVSGVGFMTRRSDFLSVGGFDERLHMYFEDVLLCRRYRDRGLEIVREPSAQVVHVGHASAETPISKARQYDEAQLRYFELVGMRRTTRLILTIALRTAGTLGLRAGGRR